MRRFRGEGEGEAEKNQKDRLETRFCLLFEAITAILSPYKKLDVLRGIVENSLDEKDRWRNKNHTTTKGGFMPKFSRFLLGFVAIFLLAAPAFSFDWPEFFFFQKNGSAVNDAFGVAVSGAGDIDGDGKADFIIGATGADPGGISNAGSAYVYSGATGALLYQKNGAAAGDNLGSVASAGDVNGDGRADFIIGAYAAAPGGLITAGSAFVYSGATGALLFQKDGAAAGDQLGFSVAGAGDVNGDGKVDFIIGARFAAPGGLITAGSAYVYSGLDGSLLYQKNGSDANYLLGNQVASVGDVNNDGRPDFIIGAPRADVGGFIDAGSAYVYSGATGSLLYQRNGGDHDDYFGESVAGVGDVNNDGRADFIIGAPNTDSGAIEAVGYAYLYSGATGLLLYKKNGTAYADDLGNSVASAGDVDGDGRADFIIGAHNADPGGLASAGSAFIYSGADGRLLYQKNGTAANENLGRSVAGAGDVNGDGRPDLIVGAAFADPGGISNAGSAYVFTIRTLKVGSILDFPNDQGKQVRIKWKWFPISDPDLDLFIIYRRIDATAANSNSGRTPTGAEAQGLPPGNWEIVASVPASGDTVYAMVAPTAVDSTPAGGLRYSVFFVRGRATQPNLFVDSPLDSGYSVDNLVPSAPSVLAAAGTCQGSVKLSYSNPVDEDFQYFKILRDTSAAFSSPIVAGTTIDSFFTDVSAPVGKTLYYRVSAVDFSGNEGSQSPQANALAGLKGDVNIDAILTAADVVVLLNATFLGSPFPAPFCAADVNCDGILTAADVVIELNLVFLGTPVVCAP